MKKNIYYLEPDDDPRIPPVRAQAPPEPNGPPQPSKGFGFGVAATIVVAAGGAAFTLLSTQASQCAGATRSSRLVWEERQAEIDAAIAAQAAETVESSDGRSEPQP